MGLSDWDPITAVGFFIFLLLMLNTYAGVNPVDTFFVQGAALFLEIPFLLIGFIATNFWLALPIGLMGLLLYLKVADGLMGTGFMAWVVVAWFMVMLAGSGAI